MYVNTRLFITIQTGNNPNTHQLMKGHKVFYVAPAGVAQWIEHML